MYTFITIHLGYSISQGPQAQLRSPHKYELVQRNATGGLLPHPSVLPILPSSYSFFPLLTRSSPVQSTSITASNPCNRFHFHASPHNAPPSHVLFLPSPVTLNTNSTTVMLFFPSHATNAYFYFFISLNKLLPEPQYATKKLTTSNTLS